jgi:hypothetical protein
MNSDNLANNGEALLIWVYYGSMINLGKNKSMGNTVGRLSKVSGACCSAVKQVNLAYLAGFLDGDGSIMLQMHRRKSGVEVYRVKTTVCFYQDNRHLKEIEWIKQILGCGYVYTRNDRICELRIEGFQKVFEVLALLKPFVRLKRNQVNLMLKLIPKLQKKSLLRSKRRDSGSLNDETVILIEMMQKYNYFSSQRKTLVDVPVTT